MKAVINSITALVMAWTLVSSTVAFAQDNGWTGGVGGNWTASTWQFGGPPDPTFDTRGIVGSTAGSSSPTAEVNVTTDIRLSNPSPTVVLGDGAGTSGTLNITSPNGRVSVVIDGGGGAGSTGLLSVGVNGGIGLLNVTGTLDVEGELESRNTADTDSTISFSGSAVVNAGSGFLDRNFIVDGSNVSASFSNNLVLGSSGTHTWKIPATGASTILVGGNADIGGTLKVEFPDGTPSVGSSWNLIDSATVDSGESPGSTGFGNIDQSSVNGLVSGSTFAVKSVADGGSSNGTYTRLTLEQHPVLVIDRSTGATSMQNFHGSIATVNFDAYVIGSSGGYLNPGSWSSIAPTNGWFEAGASSTAISELNPTSSESIAASGSLSLGSLFKHPSVFGEANEDITFRFAKPNDNSFTEGTVIYTGASNRTLTLNVDPDTGEAQVFNGTPFAVSIDSYAITSNSGSLDPNWNSLEDQGTSGGNWFEANVSTGQLSELLITGGLLLAPNSVTPLGFAFNEVSGTKDLTFQFALVGDASGDFDADGDRDGRDFLKWQRGESTSPLSISDLTDWQAGYGIPTSIGSNDYLTGDVLYSPLLSPSIGALAAIPEPNTAGLVFIGLSLIIGTRRGSTSQFPIPNLLL